ncbi:MAG: DUF3021 domain-containing protein [Clostridia bacterium]|nr:DUF3021 domain-containing protein [Clostridia bacterium]
MKKFILNFIHRGFLAGGSGPLILAVIYWSLWRSGVIETISVGEAVVGIITSFILAFVAGGIQAIYRIEKLPLLWAIFIHGLVLYMDYIIIYLMNGWLKREGMLLFTVCFFIGYGIIWLGIYFLTKKKTDQLNSKLAQKQK